MHVTPDSPAPDRAAVMLANSVLYAGQDRPDPEDPPVSFTTPDGEWTPTADDWRRVCHLVDVIVDADAVAVLVGIVGRLVGRPGGIPAALVRLDLLDHWAQARPLHRAAVLVRLAWESRHGTPARDEDPTVPDPRRVEVARRLQDAARVHEAAGGTDDSWFGGPEFPVVLPDHPGVTTARAVVDTADEAGATVASLHVALMLAASTPGGAL